MLLLRRANLRERSARAQLAIEWSAAAALSLIGLRLFLSKEFLARAPAGDRGVFIACSKLVAGGAVMYRDVFDNKPPLIYLLGAVAWRLSPDVRAVFMMERVALLVLAGVMFGMLRFAFGARLLPALVGLGMGLIALRNPDVFSGGHLTEEYGILFEMATMTCLAFAMTSARGAANAARWSVAAGVSAVLTLLTRQSFAASLVAIWIVFHAPLVREPHRLARLLAWQTAGLVLPILAWVGYLWWFGGLAQFRELLSETWTFGSAYHGVAGVKYLARELPHLRSNPDAVPARAIQGVSAMVGSVFGNDAVAAGATGVLAIGAVVIGVVRSWRGAPPLRVVPLLLAPWFAAELVAASSPGTYYGHYYLPFVPLWACTFTLAAEILLPKTITAEPAAMLRGAMCAALVAIGVLGLDASYRAEPMKYWYLFAPNARLPPALTQRLSDDARQLGLRSYVPLNTQATAILLDMPLAPGTRFLIQYLHQFPGPDSPRGRELLGDIAHADMVVEDRERSPLDQRLERAIAAVLQSTFVLSFEWSHFRFYVRRDHLPAISAPEAR